MRTNKEVMEEWVGRPLEMSDQEITARVLDQDIIDRFNLLYYFMGNQTWGNQKWLGVQIFKYPTDLMSYQEIIWEMRPDLIIECGSGNGASAKFFGMICDAIGHGAVFSIDILDLSPLAEHIAHPRVCYITGSSTHQRTIDELNRVADGKTIMVILDSDHTYEHVKDELRIYSNFVTMGQYLIVEDTNLSQEIALLHGGPARAAREFVEGTDKFIVDRSREKHILTCCPYGYLRRVK